MEQPPGLPTLGEAVYWAMTPGPSTPYNTCPPQTAHVGPSSTGSAPPSLYTISATPLQTAGPSTTSELSSTANLTPNLTSVLSTRPTAMTAAPTTPGSTIQSSTGTHASQQLPRPPQPLSSPLNSLGHHYFHQTGSTPAPYAQAQQTTPYGANPPHYYPCHIPQTNPPPPTQLVPNNGNPHPSSPFPYPGPPPSQHLLNPERPHQSLPANCPMLQNNTPHLSSHSHAPQSLPHQNMPLPNQTCSHSWPQDAGQGNHAPGKKIPKSSIDHHVSTKLRNKIWEDEFVNLRELLPPDTNLSNNSSETFLPQAERNDEGHITMTFSPSPKISDLSPLQWCRAWQIFTAIYLQRFPSQAIPLSVYAHRVITLFTSKVASWKSYDEKFRLKRASESIKWEEEDPVVYGHSLGTPKLENFRPQQETCNNYNRGKCYLARCRYLHKCLLCGKDHPLSSCWSAPRSSPPYQRKPNHFPPSKAKIFRPKFNKKFA
ncbi:proline-rich receptor-like protein kinase PERK10 isoform X1 [Lingula anatina]|uniref:Proline-rich receptor-like protein kinase PERK10 isoform X1 n=1 Tax=Lingula anatina TaxID=7574 RepID=A0A1S3J7S0_LINAN|nr:proline-rich receptor-like protein kinase PERK10 isoform X1 [Lingula anatina]|eukprot:XP_013405904.1 proline-rich receptor-like protein kinase PERK10 isoform X1 [Lingula anatina]